MRLSRAARLALFVACFVSPPPKADGAVDLYDQYTGPFDHTPPNARDAQALRTVRAALVDTAGVLDRWEGAYPCAHPWEFVRCVGGNEVTHVELSRLNLAGVLDPAVGDIASLEVLDVSSNFVTGALPASLGNLTRRAAPVARRHHERQQRRRPQQIGALLRAAATRSTTSPANALTAEVSRSRTPLLRS